MKKSLIALAVAGALTAPMIAQADATVYGSLRVKAVSSDKDGSTIDVTDNSSRWGVRGKQQTGIDGVTATYRFETTVSTDPTVGGAAFTPRLSYVGLNTGSGNFNFGRQWTPAFLMVGSMVDVLDASSNPTHDYGTEGRQSNTLSYTTPKMGGFQAALATVHRDGDTREKDLDAYNLAATYEIAGVRLAASHTDYDAVGDKAKTALAASYTMDALYLAGVYSDADPDMRNAGTGKKSYELVGSYMVNDNVKLLANYVDFGKAASADQGTQYAIEAWYKLGKKARTFINFTDVNSDRETNAGKFGSWNVGYRVDF
ncbi:MAG: porin [Halopseudomonas sp.]